MTFDTLFEEVRVVKHSVGSSPKYFDKCVYSLG